MVRNIALGIVIAAITPSTVVNSTAIIIDNHSISNTVPLEGDRSKLNFSCQKSLSSECLVGGRERQHRVYSNSWMRQITEPILERSPFLACTWRSLEPLENISHNIAALLPEQSNKFYWNFNFFRQLPTTASTSLPGDVRCPTLQQTSQDKAFTDSTIATESDRDSKNHLPLASITQPDSEPFPKLSRSSLVVDFPLENSTFIPQDDKLIEPAPATERIASPFGWRIRPYSGQLQFHQGIDYGAPYGSPVVAAGNGIVTKVVSGCRDFGNLYCGNQFGNWIEIDHGDGAIAIYGHLKNSSILVEEGMKVRKNQNIALVGSSGWSTGAHLDFRLKIDGEFQDPAHYIEQ